MSIPYRFMPWVRRGLARSHQNADAVGAPLATRPKVTIGLTIQAQQDGNGVAAVSGNIDLALYAPGDVIGIDPRLMVRTDPKPGITNFEPNYLAIVDFDPPDFPWMLTPARADTGKPLRPWLVLIVVDRSIVSPPTLKSGHPLPSITLSAAAVATELPDLAESSLWAHAQAVSERGKADSDGLGREMQAAPARNISRLVCPRRLEERKSYVACVVPAFDAGRLRGLGQPVQSASLGPAWDSAQPTEMELPVYFHWEFSTGPVGDIETLARRLKRPDQYASNSPADVALRAQLQHIGEQVIAVDGDHLLFTGTTPGRTIFEGAMVSLDFKPSPADGGFAAGLEAMLNSGQALATSGVPKADLVPTLSPPIYGEHPAKRHAVVGSEADKHWLDGLSLQPRYRLAAGWGAELVRRNQDEFMQAAWQQVGDVLAAERAFSLSRLSRDILKRIEVRHLAKLPEARLLAVLAPARARIKVAPEESLFGRIGTATLPDEIFGGAMRRLTSARRPTFRMAQWRERDLAQVGMTQQMTSLVDRFANVTKNLDAIDPNRVVPDGFLGSRSFDNIKLPDDAAAMVDLMPYLGLPGSLPAGEIRQIQRDNATLRGQAQGAVRKPPAIGDVWHRGLVTETHALRLAELERAAGAPLAGNFVQLIQGASVRGSEGVLLSVQQDGQLGNQVSAQALKIDGRSGNLKPFAGRLVTGGGRGAPAVRATRATATGSVGAVSIRALRLYGNDAVFTSLPANTLGQGGKAVSIGVSAPGRFDAVPGLRPDDPVRVLPTITMPPAIKDRAVLERYSEAFKGYQDQWSALPQEQSVIAVDFAMASSASHVRTRLDPGQTVPARLASTLSLGDQPVAWTSAGMSNTFISTSLKSAFTEQLRYVIPRTFDRVMAFPHLPFPLSRKLEVLAPDVFLPGVGVLPEDFIMAVKTNPRFVEALMVGANHEMGRELLWQGFPTDQRGTPFQHFWQRLNGGTDIAPINEWLDSPLGQQHGSTPMLVLLIRGQLLERFPTLSVYGYPIDANENRPGGSSPPVAADVDEPRQMDPKRMIPPVMKGHLGKDITYVGFAINPDDMAKYFFILEEQMTEPRFGFDERVGNGENSNKWLDVDWLDIGVGSGAYFGSAALQQAQPAVGNPKWAAPHAAMVADALLQRPFRGYYTGASLKTLKNA